MLQKNWARLQQALSSLTSSLHKEKDDINGEKFVNESFLLQTECTPIEDREILSSELELQVANELPSDSGATVAYSLPTDAEPTIRNEVLAFIDVDVDKIALVDVGDYDYIQATVNPQKLLTYQTKKL